MKAATTHNVTLDSIRATHFVAIWISFILLVIGGVVFNKVAPAPVNRHVVSGNSNFIFPNATCSIQGVNYNYCVQHAFQFHSVFTQMFSMEMNVTPKNGVLSNGVSNKAMDMRFRWVYSGDATVSDSKQLDAMPVMVDRTIEREVGCNSATGACAPVSLFKTTSVNYPWYAFSVIGQGSQVEWIQNIELMFVFRNLDYGLYELVARIILASFALIASVVFAYRIAKAGSASEEQKWVLALLITSCLYNNPVYGLRYVLKGDANEWIDSILQATFGATLLLHWLVTFDSLRTEAPRPFKTFYLPKIIFVGIFFVVGVVAYGVLQYIESTDLLFNWFENQGVQNFIRVFGIIFVITYLVWMLVLVVRVAGDMRSSNFKTQMIYYFTIFACLVILGAVAVTGSFSGDRYSETGDFIVFNIMFTAYPIILAVLYTPVGVEAMKGAELTDEASPSTIEIKSFGSPSAAMTKGKKGKGANIVPSSVGTTLSPRTRSMTRKGLNSGSPSAHAMPV